MTARILRQLAFSIHAQTLHSLGIRLDQVAAFDSHGELVWLESTGPLGREAMAEARAGLWRDTAPGAAPGAFLQGELSAGGRAFGVSVTDDVDGHLLDIVLTTEPGTALDAQGAGCLERALSAVGEGIRNEYQLNKELETMATELAERYEELNLVFQSDSSPHSVHYGFESLRSMVKDTIEFLDVGIAALVLPAKDLEIYDCRDPAAKAGIPHLLFRLRRRLFGRVETGHASLVLNNDHDRLHAGLPADIPYKLVVAPVDSGGSTTVGMLVVANPRDCDDFSNSDRNLIEVMSRKISKVLQANFDTMTGLENGSSFEWVVGQALFQARTRSVQHALLQIDIDRTNVVNDVSGRAAGDEVVRRPIRN